MHSNVKIKRPSVLVRDLIYNNDFDCNCNYEIYDCTEEGKQWGEESELIFSTKRDGFDTPSEAILNMKIKYITISGLTLVIEASR